MDGKIVEKKRYVITIYFSKYWIDEQIKLIASTTSIRFTSKSLLTKRKKSTHTKAFKLHKVLRFLSLPFIYLKW